MDHSFNVEVAMVAGILPATIFNSIGYCFILLVNSFCDAESVHFIDIFCLLVSALGAERSKLGHNATSLKYYHIVI